MSIPSNRSDHPPLLGIIAAYRWEISPLLRRQFGVQRTVTGEYHLKLPAGDAVLALSGAGTSNARRVAQRLLSQYKLSALVSAGFAGGLVEGLSAGKLLLADVVIDEASGQRYPCDFKYLREIQAARGQLVTVQAVAGRVEQKTALHVRWQAVSADMEAAAVAQEAAAAELPFAALKAITDGPTDILAIDFQRCLSANGGLSSGKIVIEGLRGITQFRSLCLLAWNSRIAANNLAAALSRW
ncbi:MAG: hypothetical protein EXQ56_12475 [Acidobacteria bacterium]|nr:hypothetical protein [Acidobacteriota bacterium]